MTATEALALFARGCAIPAHPLALTARRRLDERRQRALTRYYLATGAGGLAVGVHTTQFAIHDNGLLSPVLELAAETVAAEAGRPVVLIAGVQGPTEQAVREAELAAALGYHLALLAPATEVSEAELLDRARAVGEVLPVIGFYLQPAVGGRVLSAGYWTEFAAIPSVAGIKVAPFDRYRTLDVLHGVCRSGRLPEIALYTGNDNHILPDLAIRNRVTLDGRTMEVEFVGGLLGQWAVWTEPAVRLHAEAAAARAGDDFALRRLLVLDGSLTDANAVIFDVAGGFHGCIPGIHEILRRQGLLAGRWCLDPGEDLSPGQLEEIDRVCLAYPELTDDDFIAERLDGWLG
ncbi:dihydrodipicolinate synthase family protein [Acrocarpospora macrocephala]|uniref:Dihydrodipicolinate synthase family protein n=1 Tax=Acrocarpospora macrocephala TaxID=150177 RepID=A0A5M3X2F5_9ACTN|nr:dihydrodipicolinate synthase family protein [Acrocarpospora macrocephala]GES14259.1 dihydrodipicolinate synthase family protein [Acrocarpospora macrocephala]